MSRYFLAAYAVLFALLHLAANVSGWYYLYPWLDIPMHLGGGIWVAWVAVVYRSEIRGYTALPLRAQALGVIAVVGLGGGVWEVLEGTADALQLMRSGIALWDIPDLLGHTQAGIYWDTLFDLTNDLVGSCVVVLAWLVGRFRR
jgi:hypothetical protein